jgi:hypothetical protein
MAAGQQRSDQGNGINALIATANSNLFAGSYGDGVFRPSDNAPLDSGE